jgi:glycosyltransferase involved in cell wall biosynthesis
MVLHGGKLPEFIEKNPRRAKSVLGRADRLVAPSAILAGRIGAHGFDVRVIPNVIEIGSYAFRERRRPKPKLLWMRSFHPVNNPEMAIEVLLELRKFHPNATLTMAGMDKGLEPKIKKMAEELNLSDSVSFPGFLDPEQKRRVFSEADIFLNTNRFDNMPVAVVEACACGLPVVATRVGGLPFLISDGRNGLLVENENAREMTEAVKLLLEDKSLARKSAVRASWEKLFTEVLSRKRENSAAGFPARNLTIEKQKNQV